MIKLLIFDLDDTLYDATAITEQGARLAVRAMIKAGLPASEEDACRKRLELLRWTGPFFEEINKQICTAYGIANEQRIDALCAAAREGYNAVDVKGIALFPGVRQMLERLKKKQVLILISSGIEELQQRKIATLGIAHLFEHICIADGDARTKSSCLRQALERYHYPPSQICVIGDRIDSEIRHANELGMVTVQHVHGKYRVLKPKDALEKPTYTVNNIVDVERLIEKIE